MPTARDVILGLALVLATTGAVSTSPLMRPKVEPAVVQFAALPLPALAPGVAAGLPGRG